MEADTRRIRRPGPTIFSDDEDENKFLEDLSWVSEDHWISSEMPWNKIHGVAWQRCEKLGEGSYGTVFVGQRADLRLFAVKSINIKYPMLDYKPKKMFQSQLAEIQMMKNLKSKYIVRSLGCGRSNGTNGMNNEATLDIFLEYAIRGSLRHVMRKRKNPFPEDPYIRQYTHDVLKALQYMRAKNIVHGDIKAANLLLADDCVKVCDWGGAKKLDKTNLTTILIGTLGFRSPEVIRGTEQSYASDIFSLGCTVIEMATFFRPDEIKSMVTGIDSFSNRTANWEKRVKLPEGLSPECQDFLKHCLCKRMEDRWTAAELLTHPFIVLRDVHSTLPFDQPVDRLIHSRLLRAPSRYYDDLDVDERVTKRVYRYLKQEAFPAWWSTGLLGCGPDDPPLYPLSPPQSGRLSDPDVLPPFVPDFILDEHTKLDEDLLRAFPNVIDEVTGKSMNFAAVRRPGRPPLTMLPLPSTPDASNSIDERDQLSANGPIPPQSSSAPPSISPEEAEKWVDGLIEHAGLMCDLNDQLFEEAQLAAKQPLGDDDTDDLFQHDSKRSKAGSRRTRQRRGGPAAGPIASTGGALGCGGGAAVDVLEPERRKGKK